MKSKLKGFTLIELIVVIAIIGVLAAILVPSMLGYVEKAKIQGANTNAGTLHKAINAYIGDLTFEDEMISDGVHTISSGTYTSGTTGMEDFGKSIKIYFSDIDKTEGAFYIKSGECRAVSIQNKKYYGTYPILFTPRNWKKNYASKVNNPTDAVNEVVKAKKLDQ